MITKVYYLEDNETNNNKVNEIINNYICFVKKETIEMNYFELTIICRVEDISSIENDLKDII
jgi:hypothetical protein